MTPTVTVCVPMYNESAIAAETVRTLYRAMDGFRKVHGWSFEILFSDDGSRDGCADIVRRTAEEEGLDGVRVLRYEDNRGKGSAVREAVLASTGEIVVYTDCDLAYGTDAIGEAVSRFAEGVDAVLGSRNLTKDGHEGYTPLRKLASKIYVKVLALAAGFHRTDSQCGLKALRGDVARRVFGKCKTNGFAFDFEVLLLLEKVRANIVEIPVKIVNHRASTVHIVRDSIRMLRDIKKIKRHVKSVEL